jgi:hypothetical protein
LRESPELTVGRIRARKETVINPLPRYELWRRRTLMGVIVYCKVWK